MGRKKIDWGYQEAIEAIRKARQAPAFHEALEILRVSLEAHEARRLEAQRQGDCSAAFPDWEWRNVTFDQGRIQYSGPHYDLRRLCDNFGLPWPESREILMRMLFASTEADLRPTDFPSPKAWRAWRMAKTGLGRPRQEQIQQAKELLGEYTPHGRERSFDDGLTQEAVAYILGVNERTVRKWVSDCWRYARTGSLSKIGEAASLSDNELTMLVVLTRMIEGKKRKNRSRQ